MLSEYYILSHRFQTKKMGTIATDYNRIFLHILFFILNKKLYLCR